MTSPGSPVRAPRAAFDHPTRRRGPLGAAGAVLAVTAALALVLTLTGSAAASVIAPGNFKGMGFDACSAPSSKTMDRWMRAKENPYRAVAVYISGQLRGCSQPHLNRKWVTHQTRMGWHIIPITVGRQASCSKFRKRVSSKPANRYAKARKQARIVARHAVKRAHQLGMRKKSTLYYDMEAWHIGYNRCDAATLWFLSTWTKTLHRYGYAGGVYSSGASGIAKLDQMASHTPKGYQLPDYIWFAAWNGKETTATSYIKKSHWTHHRRIHQFLGGHNAHNGGVTLNIDSNWINVRRHKIKSGNKNIDKPKQHRYRCTHKHVTHVRYPATSARKHKGYTGTLQCLLRRSGDYKAKVTGTWNKATKTALHRFQRSTHLPVSNVATRRAWTALLAHGVKPAKLRDGDSKPVRSVLNLARALNAAIGAGLHGTGYFGDVTRGAVRKYNKQVVGKKSGVATKATWKALKAGRVGKLISKRELARLAAAGTDTRKDADFSAASPSAGPSSPASSLSTAAPSPSAFATAPLDQPQKSGAARKGASMTTAPTHSPSASASPEATRSPAQHSRETQSRATHRKSPKTKPAEHRSAHRKTYADTHPVTREAVKHALDGVKVPKNAGNPSRSSAAGIEAPTRKGAPVRPAVLQAQVPDMDPAATTARTDAPALTPRMLLARQLPQVLSNLDVETDRAVRLFVPWLED